MDFKKSNPIYVQAVKKIAKQRRISVEALETRLNAKSRESETIRYDIRGEMNILHGQPPHPEKWHFKGSFI